MRSWYVLKDDNTANWTTEGIVIVQFKNPRETLWLYIEHNEKIINSKNCSRFIIGAMKLVSCTLPGKPAKRMSNASACQTFLIWPCSHYAGRIRERRFHSESASNVFRPHYTGGIYKRNITGHSGFAFTKNSVKEIT